MNEYKSVNENKDDDRATSDRFDRVFWERFWRLVRPYWASDRRGRAFVLVSAMTVLNLGTVGMQAVFSYVSRDVMNALQAKDAARFHHLLMLFALWIVVFVPIAALYPYLSGLLSIDWRDWMTERFVKGMLQGNALYYIMRDRTVDNPDQRISEDVNSFGSGALSYSMTVLQAVVTAMAFFGILWGISRWLAASLIGYSLAGSWLAVVIGRRLVVINFNQQRYEADYRFALVHARDNAEAIALYNGARDEAQQLRQRFAKVVDNFKLLILWQRHLTLFTAAYDNAAGLVPYFVLAGAYFSGRFALGEFTQAAYAFSVLQGSMSLVVDQFQALTDYASVVNRLAVFEESCEKAATKESDDQRQIEVVEDDSQIALKNITLETPDRVRVLQQDISLAVADGDALLVTGPTGAGKTSLMRAVAGLWRAGSGRILRPSVNHILFMPQKPYLILGSIRQQIQYPRADAVSDETLMEVLREVDLAYLPGRFGGLDAELNWADLLSGGEQQRLAFARLLLSRPRFAILDEATSALDIASEERLYSRLASLPIAFISIGHRPSLRKFHKQVIELSLGVESTTESALLS
ncbi:ABC transporter ATP-binding protein/permease [Candidatus Binatus sp.]|uniref:ABC transporter ATP-binding protein/permease n=1 Tax=Candidatus Binatus sp. TaxID=2811406 RepID=UPI003C41E745